MPLKSMHGLGSYENTCYSDPCLDEKNDAKMYLNRRRYKQMLHYGTSDIKILDIDNACCELIPWIFGYIM